MGVDSKAAVTTPAAALAMMTGANGRGDVDWTDDAASNVVVGWNVANGADTEHVMYKVVDNIVFVKFNITGTSDSASTNFDVPYTAASDSTSTQAIIVAVDNGTVILGKCSLSAASATVNCYYGPSTSDTWTTSGTKSIYGEFFYAK